MLWIIKVIFLQLQNVKYQKKQNTAFWGASSLYFNKKMLKLIYMLMGGNMTLKQHVKIVLESVKIMVNFIFKEIIKQ